MPLVFAKRISDWAEPRTWVTVPGADSTVSVHMVWIESMIGEAPAGALAQRGDDVLDIGLRGEFDRRVAEPEPLGPQPHLRDRFFAGNIGDALARLAPARQQACISRVDLPMPGSPPSRMTEPCTKPPPVTRSSSAMPEGDARRFLGLAGQAFEREDPALGAGGARGDRPAIGLAEPVSSTMLFQPPQASHLPFQRL